MSLILCRLDYQFGILLIYSILDPAGVVKLKLITLQKCYQERIQEQKYKEISTILLNMEFFLVMNSVSIHDGVSNRYGWSIYPGRGF
jgi:hypothetical protein